MPEVRNFPKIIVLKSNGGFEAIAGLKMVSILKKELFMEPEEEKSEGKSPRESRECLIHAVSSWSADVSLELHMTSFPDLSQYNNSRIMISVFIRSLTAKRERAIEYILSCYMNLAPLLTAFIPEAEFETIVDAKELKERFSQFNCQDAVSICRRKKYIRLSSPLNKLSIGFEKLDIKEVKEPGIINHLFPWIPSMDDWSGLMDCLTGQLDPVKIIVRIIPGLDSSEAENRLEETARTCESFLSGNDPGNDCRQQIKFIRDATLKQLAGIREARVNMGIFVFAPKNINATIANVIGKAITGAFNNQDKINLFQGGFIIKKAPKNYSLRWNYLSEKYPFTITEAACVFRLPDPPTDNQPGLPVKRFRTSHTLLRSENAGIKKNIDLFVNEHRGRFQPISMGVDDRMAHSFIIGKTGTGKSTLMESMILQDIYAGRGVGVIDPHGDMVDSILGKIPLKRVEDVVYFNMLDKERPLGFNILECKTEGERDIIIDELYLTIDRLYDLIVTGGPIFENNFRGVLSILMGDKPEKDFVPTLLEFSYFYLNADFRNWLKKRTKDTKLHDFIEELERTTGDASLNNLAPYITSKLSRYSYDSTLRRIVGQERSSLDFDDILNNGKIFLMKLGRGRFGSNVSALIANQIVARFKLAAMKRGEMRPEDRRDFFMYIDECHTLPRENFMDLLSEARKFRLGLVLATQFASQLGDTFSQKNDLLSAILGNVGSIFIFRLGIKDADFLAPVLYPYFKSDDILCLPNWNGYTALNIRNHYTPAFSFRTFKDKTPFKEKIANDVIAFSRSQYGTDADLIDEQIEKRREKWKK